jgi:hypothetical protein
VDCYSLKIAAAILCGWLIAAGFASAEESSNQIEGHVLSGGSPISGSTVTLWAASAKEPENLARTKTGNDGRFTISIPDSASAERSHYLIARGGQAATNDGGDDNPAIALLTVLGNEPPANVVVNEMTTVASVWTHAQFIDGTAIKGHALGLRIAAGNVPNFVDLGSGGWGEAIQGPLNSGQTTTMANFATLADILAGCVTQVTADACGKLFAAATGPDKTVPADTLTAARSIARAPWYEPKRLYALLAQFYPIPEGKNLRAVPYMPYLNFAPSAWVLPLKFAGGGLRAGGKGMFDSEGNLWSGSNFTVGWQAQASLWQGNAAKFAPNGCPLSPKTTGFTGGGMEGGTFGVAVDAKDNAWLTNYGGESIAVFDKSGKPLTGPEGITFDGRLGQMQGIIATPSGDVWALGISKNQLVHFPEGDFSQGRIVCEGEEVEPCKSLVGPFFLGIDQRDRIWVTNGFGEHVTRFPAGDPSKAETFKTGWSGAGLAIDSKGNVWVTNRLGNSAFGALTMGEIVAAYETGLKDPEEVLTRGMSKHRNGSVALLRPDGTAFPASPFTGDHLPGPWAAAVDGNDNVWISNFVSPNSPITQLCGVRTEKCPPGFKTGDAISPPGGYVGGGMQMLTDIAIGPAGDVWTMNNWQDLDICFATSPDEALSTRCGGQGVTIFFGLAKPVAAPQIGPARAP